MQGDLQRDAADKPQENSFRPIDNSPFDRHLTLADLLCVLTKHGGTAAVIGN